jgi:glucuronosyltransferase
VTTQPDHNSCFTKNTLCQCIPKPYSSMSLLLFLLINYAFCADILVIFDTPCYSHEIILRDILSRLIDDGHKLTVFSTFLDFHDHASVTRYTFKHTRSEDFERILTGDKLGLLDDFRFVIKAFISTREQQMMHPEMRRIIETKPKFDLIILECMMSPVVALGQHLDCPVVVVFASFIPSKILDIALGNHMSPAVHAAFEVNHGIDGELNLSQRLESFVQDSLAWTWAIKKICCKAFEWVMTEVGLEQQCHHSQNIPRIELVLVMTKVMDYFGRIQPRLPYEMLHVHSTHLGLLMKSQQVDEKLMKFLEGSTKPVVLISFGSIVRLDLLRVNMTATIIAAINELSNDFDFIWKAKNNDVTWSHKNLFIAPWLPVVEILKHPRVKMFVNHGGLRSIEEGIKHQVPMVIVPILWDQFANAEFAMRGGIAMKLELNNSNDHRVLVNAIRDVTSESYSNNINEASAAIHDEFEAGIDEVVWHIEHAMKFNNSTRYVGFHFPVYQRLHLDVAAVTFGLIYFVVKFIKIVKGFI